MYGIYSSDHMNPIHFRYSYLGLLSCILFSRGTKAPKHSKKLTREPAAERAEPMTVQRPSSRIGLARHVQGGSPERSARDTRVDVGSRSGRAAILPRRDRTATECRLCRRSNSSPAYQIWDFPRHSNMPLLVPSVHCPKCQGSGGMPVGGLPSAQAVK